MNSPSSLVPVRILCAADAAFAAPLCVMLVSLLANFSRNRAIEFYVLTPDMPMEDRNKIEQALRDIYPGFGASALHWLSSATEQIQGLQASGHVNVMTYSRLLAPFVLPEECERVLYLDSDMVVLSDVSAIYDLPDDGRAVHAVHDVGVGTVSAPFGVFNYADLGIPPETPYFNGGVMLIHLPYWRRENIAARILDYLARHDGAVNYWDQGGLNSILSQSWIALDLAWNQTRAVLFPERWTKQGCSLAEWRRVRDNPKIIHFTSGYKPWLRPGQLTHRLMPRPGHSFFFQYLKLTPYRDEIRDSGLERVIGYRAYTWLWHSLFPIVTLFRKKKTAEEAG